MSSAAHSTLEVLCGSPEFDTEGAQTSAMTKDGACDLQGVLCVSFEDLGTWPELIRDEFRPNRERAKHTWLAYLVSKDAFYALHANYVDILTIFSHQMVTEHGEKCLNLYTAMTEHQSMHDAGEGTGKRVGRQWMMGDKLCLKKRTHWCGILEHIIAIVQYLTEQTMAFCGTSDALYTYGNFLGQVQHLSQFDSIMAEHLHRIRNKEVIDHILGRTYRMKLSSRTIVGKVKDVGYFSMILNCMPDIRNQEQMTSILETFEDVAVDFSLDEWKMLTKWDKLLYQEVMIQNFEHMVSIGYDIPLEQLLSYIEKPVELPFHEKVEDMTVLQTDLPEVPVSINRYVNHTELQNNQLSVQNNLHSKYDFPDAIQSYIEEQTHVGNFAFKPAIKLQQRIHTGCKLYKCYTCNKIFIHKKALSAHKKIHIIKKPYKCGICDKSFARKANVLTHKKIHTGEKPYKCAVCGKSFTRKDNVLTHEKVHTGEKPYKCAVCGKHFRWKNNLLAHQNVHVGEKPYKCTTCDKSFVRKCTLSKHEKLHTEKRYKCAICNRIFTDKTELSAHGKMHTEEKPYTCITCDKNFLRKRDLSVHQKIHVVVEKPYKCATCDKNFPSEISLSAHEKVHNTEKPYKCNKCYKSYKMKTTFENHQKLHTGEIKCTECSKCFTQLGRLHLHRTIHTDILHKCTECGKSFTCATDMKRHQVIHTGPEKKIDWPKKSHKDDRVDY
ncbi:zinc finger protein 1 homolog [Protopterus annectens]|uniref:zinc finger protein 1 homolog n=1 Tax=Protopterus annectens TaxID=7888 RepID=UPI001CFAE0C6|nr:zinc finger protein 1 homolog [Protopterus annectens]